ncbi:restriction endonuclease subunit S [Bacillus mycoides]|uniref:restriction endonuclease subunit S n=1 Tax=Bacillus mycoides TaxID=1405 RepID=UPI000A27D8F8|nr:restriction endonuclease subunit S [Bacillus mycoides]OSX88000.1 Type I restriction-modification system, specificity subunit S [Bacillus mycoides]
MSKKKKKTIEELLEDALVQEGQPFKIPGNWRWTKLNFIAEWGSGGTPKSTVPEYYNGDIPWLVIGDLNDDVVYQSARTITELGLKNSSAKHVEKGSILIAMYGSIGKLGIAGVDCATNQAIAFTKQYYKNIERKYLFFYLLSIRNRLLSLGKGGTQQNISQTVLKDVIIPLPPLSEQKRIAEKVERLLNKIDEAKQLIGEAKETLSTEYQAVLDKAFKGQLTDYWRRNKDTQLTRNEFLIQIKEERIKLAKNKKDEELLIEQFNTVLDQSEDLPKGWLKVKLSLICDNITKGTTPKTSEITPEGNIPFLKVYNIVNNEINFEYKPGFIPEEVHKKQLKRSIVYPGDVIMNIVGPPLGKVAIIPNAYPEWNINQALAIFRPIKGVVSEYIYYSLLYEKTLTEVFRETRGVVGQSNISLEQCKNLEIAIPPLDEQFEIVKKLRNIFKALKVIDDQISYTFNSAKNTLEGILVKAFRGELGTNDSTEESAIELLKEVLQEQVK